LRTLQEVLLVHIADADDATEDRRLRIRASVLELVRVRRADPARQLLIERQDGTYGCVPLVHLVLRPQLAVEREAREHAQAEQRRLVEGCVAVLVERGPVDMLFRSRAD